MVLELFLHLIFFPVWRHLYIVALIDARGLSVQGRLLLPPRVDWLRACVLVRSCVRRPRLSRLQCDSKQKAAKGLAFFFLRLASCDHGWRHGSRRHELRRGALRLRCRAKQTGFVRCGSGICPPDGNWWRGGGKWQVASGNAPACAARLRRGGGWEHWGTRARDRGHVRRGGCGRYGCNGSNPIPTSPPAGRVLSRPIADHGRLVVLFFRHPGRAGRQNRGAARRHGRVSSRCREGRLTSRALTARLRRPLRRIRPASLYRYAAWDTHMMPSA